MVCTKPGCNCVTNKLIGDIISSTRSEHSIFYALKTLAHILKNVMENPNEQKFQTLKMTNKKLKEVVLDVQGTAELLQHVGFQQQKSQQTDENVLKLATVDQKQLQVVYDLIHVALFRLFGNLGTDTPSDEQLEKARHDREQEVADQVAKQAQVQKQKEKLTSIFNENREDVQSRPISSSKRQPVGGNSGQVHKFSNEDLMQSGGEGGG